MDVTLVALLPASPAWALLLVGVLLVLAARAPVQGTLTAAERYWFLWAFEGADVEHPDFGMTLAEDDTAESLLAAYRDAVARSNEIVERCHDLSRPSARAAGKADARRSMRWVLIHMIEETARHAGHADILRAQADGSVGR
ncbi:DUF664 domain-containing protein [Streptomyces sp. NPDC058989]|uniref:mycothiol transferase n=1 Tax=Streptomyces sp. NPDC058989 TaxID=3346686 RepID=UPI00367A5FE9